MKGVTIVNKDGTKFLFTEEAGLVEVASTPATAAEAAALPAVFILVAGDDGTDVHPLQLDGAGSLKAVLQASAVALGTVGITSITQPTAIYAGRKTVTTPTSAEALAASQALVSDVTVKALATNTGIVYVGGSDVSSTKGFELAAGEWTVLIVANLATVYLDVSVGGEGVTYHAS